MSVASRKDSIEVAKLFAAHLESFKGAVALDTGIACLDGRVCSESNLSDDRADRARKSSFYKHLRAYTKTAKAIPRQNAAKCKAVYVDERDCTLQVDYYFQVYEPTISETRATVAYNVSTTSRSSTGDYLMSAVRSVVLKKVDGKWSLVSEHDASLHTIRR